MVTGRGSRRFTAARVKRRSPIADIPVMSRRTLAMAACLATAWVPVALSGCGGGAAPQAAGVSAAAIESAERSVVKVRCTNADVNDDLLSAAVGTGFVTQGGIVTASHVVSSCAGAGPGSVSAGPFVVSVGANDPTLDLALMRLGPAGTAPPLALEAGLPSPGARVELIGSPGDQSGPGVRPIAGTVLATNAEVTLYSEAGASETLSGHDRRRRKRYRARRQRRTGDRCGGPGGRCDRGRRRCSASTSRRPPTWRP